MQYARTITGAAHPNIVKVYHCGEQDRLAYIVMELVTGGSSSAVQREPARQAWSRSGWTAVGLIKQAADGLDSAHTKGITHGAIKPPNLLLTTPDLATARVKVSDLGLLQVVGESGLLAGVASAARHGPMCSSGPMQDLFVLGVLALRVDDWAFSFW